MSTEIDSDTALPAARSRDRSIDVLKGLGILVVAMGHIDASGVGGAFVTYLYTFNVALFFIVAGYMWRDKPDVGFWSLAYVKFRQIYVPYVVLFFVSLLYGHLFVRFVFRDYVIPFEPIATLKALVLSSEWLNTVPTFNFALWFLPIFFIASVLFPLLQKIRNIYAYVAVVGVIMVATLPIQQLLPGRPPLSINVLPVALAFMGCGYLVKRWLDVRRINLFILIPIFAFTLVAAFLVPGNVSNVVTLWYFPSALASFILYLRLAQDIRSSWFFGYIGEFSLIVFGIHGLVANTYPHTHISDFFSSWGNGLMLYLINLAYVILVSVLAVMAYRALRGLFNRSMARRRERHAESREHQAA